MSNSRKNIFIALAGVAALVVCFIAGKLFVPKEEGVAQGTDSPATAPEAVPPVSPDPVTVYGMDMTVPPGDEWSDPGAISKTPAGDRPFLGRFLIDKTPTLTIKALPPHQLVRISFDLFLLQSWNGSSAMWGPSTWGLTLGDGRSLVHTTFCNCGFFNDNNEQAFPDAYPSKPYPAWTLAVEHETLGTIQNWGGPARTFDASSVYRMVLTFPHSEPDIEFQFNGGYGQRIAYGLTNVSVQTIPRLKTLTPEEMQAAWQDLGLEEPQLFYDARWKLVSAGDAATDFIATHIGEIKIPDVPKVTDPNTPGMQSRASPYPEDTAVIYRERARDVLEAIHTEKARALKRIIPAFVPQ